MVTVSDIKEAVQALPEDLFEEFSAWFDEYEEEHWDRQIGRDQESGPLRDLVDEARADFQAGKCSRLWPISPVPISGPCTGACRRMFKGQRDASSRRFTLCRRCGI